MIQITAQMRVLVAIEAVDGPKGIDSLVRLCQEKLAEDPFSGCLFVFRSRSGTAIRLVTYEWSGLMQKRFPEGDSAPGPTQSLEGSKLPEPVQAAQAETEAGTMTISFRFSLCTVVPRKDFLDVLPEGASDAESEAEARLIFAILHGDDCLS